MNKVHVKTGDTVVVLSGKNKGKEGKVLEVSPKEQKVIVEGINMVIKHVKPRQAGQVGGRVEAEGPIRASKLMLKCPKCQKPTRLAHKLVGEGENQKKMRLCKKCGETF